MLQSYGIFIHSNLIYNNIIILPNKSAQIENIENDEIKSFIVVRDLSFGTKKQQKSPLRLLTKSNKICHFDNK